MKNLLKMFSGLRGAKSAVIKPVIHLAAFGKHPGWDDHIPGVGLDTESLAYLKHAFYVTGIGGQIDAGAWEKLEAGKRVEGFEHAFIWARNGHLLMGRLWSSTDRKGRSKYPMILAVDSTGISPGYLLTNVWRELDALRTNCRTLTAAEAVESACRTTLTEMRSRLEFLREMEGDIKIPVEARRQFLEHPDFGGGQVGLLRILHELTGLSAVTKSRKAAAGSSPPGRHLRVPAIGRAHDEIFRLWLDFLQRAIPSGTPLLLIWREGAGWLDVTVGEPAGGDFFCLQAAPLAVPLSTQIPYELGPELAGRLQQLAADWQGASSLPANPVTPDPPPATSSGSRLPLILLLGLAFLVVAGTGWFFFSSPRSTPAPDVTTPPPAAAPTPATSPTPSAPATPPATPPAATPAPPTKSDAVMQPVPAALPPKQVIGSTPVPAMPVATLTATNDAAAKFQSESAYQAVLAQARKALVESNFSLAIEQAGVALKSQPNDADALLLRRQAQTRLNEQVAQAALRQQQEQFDGLLLTGQGDLARKDYAGAVSNANAALDLLPESEAARTLRASARRLVSYAAAVSAGNAALQQGDYEEAAKQAAAALALNASGTEALSLQAGLSGGKDLQQVKTLLGQADYAGALALCNQHANEPAFATVAAQSRLGAVQAVDEQLEVYAVWFGLLTPDHARFPKARLPAQKEMARELANANFTVQNFNEYTALVSRLEQQLRALQSLDSVRAETIAKLKKQINEHL